jgi:hypothetical protein
MREYNREVYMRKCSVEGCSQKSKTRGYCSKHYQRKIKSGELKKLSKEDRFVPNKVIDIDKNTIGIVLEGKNKEIRGIAKINKKDYFLIKKERWHLTYYGYAAGTKTKKLMHLFLNPDWEHTDHINRDKLDNRRCNLRKCSHHQNTCNQPIRNCNTSGVVGVYWSSQRKKWQAFIKYKYKAISLGRYLEKEDAIRARILAEKKYYGEFAPQHKKYQHLIGGSIK